jgi:hypothetical protein
MAGFNAGNGSYQCVNGVWYETILEFGQYRTRIVERAIVAVAYNGVAVDKRNTDYELSRYERESNGA